MVSLCLQYGLLISVLGASLADNAVETAEKTIFSECFWYEATDGTVALGTPLISLARGMCGTMAIPNIRASNELAERFAPLVTRLQETKPGYYHWIWEFPRPREIDASVVLIGMEAAYRDIYPEPASAGSQSRPHGAYSYPIALEIVLASIFRAELVPCRWIDAFYDLDKTLNEIVMVSRTEPSAAKRDRLGELFEHGGRAYHTMINAKPAEDEVQAVRRVAPEARLVRSRQEKIEKEWGDTLRIYSAQLDIPVSIPPPTESRECSGQQRFQMLIESNTPADFMRKMHESCPDWVLEEYLTSVRIRDRRTSRPVYTWQVEKMTPEEFAALRQEVATGLERQSREQQIPPDPIGTWKDKLKDTFGIEVEVAPEELLRDNLFLAGTVVEKVIDSGKAIGLKPGDLIIDYAGITDLVLRPRTYRFDCIQPGQTLPVLREGRLIQLTIQKPTTSEAQPRSSR